jgi:four helix bundle protein
LRRFCSIALGSASELDYHLLLARDLGYLKAAVYEALLPLLFEVQRMLAALLKKLSANSQKPAIS